MSKTPRTDAVAAASGYSWGNDVSIYSNLCLQLETENTELREALAETLRYAHMMHDSAEDGPDNPTAQAIGKAIRKASAILEKTK